MSSQTPLGWISYGVCQEILTENLNMRCKRVCLELREKASKEPTFISRIITGDESWIYDYDPEPKQHLSLWKSPQSLRAKKVRQVGSSTKSMFIVFFDVKGIVHREFVPPTRNDGQL
jgi:hypothetical protein